MKSKAATLRIQTVFLSLAQLKFVVEKNREYKLGFDTVEALWDTNPHFIYGSCWERSRIDRSAIGDFERGYIVCALWSDLNEEKTIDDIEDESLAEMLYDCHLFLWQQGHRLNERSDYKMGDMGHDFWLSRNRHGTGFWDRGLGAVGNDLHQAAVLFGPKNVEVDEDGRVIAF